MADREKLVSRIQKLLALASRNPSAAEAEVALLQARKLMAEHDVRDADVVEQQDKVDAAEVMSSGRMNDLKVAVLAAIAAAHRCRLMRSRRRHAQTTIKLIGFERDRAVVVALNDWAWRSVSSAADRFVKQTRERFAKNGMTAHRSDLLTVRRSFVLGFASGLSQAYRQQIEANPQWALVLATPPEVQEFLDRETNGRAHTSNRGQVDGNAFRAGVTAGTEHVSATSHRDAPRLEGLPRLLGA